jgi:hypothetical protein
LYISPNHLYVAIDFNTSKTAFNSCSNL